MIVMKEVEIHTQQLLILINISYRNTHTLTKEPTLLFFPQQKLAYYLVDLLFIFYDDDLNLIFIFFIYK